MKPLKKFKSKQIILGKDDVLAYKWLNLAAASGNNEAEELRKEAANSMTPDQIAEAQKLSREWKVAE